MTLTSEGAVLKVHVDKILADLNEMIVHAAALRGTVAGDLRVGIHTEPDLLRIPELFSSLQVQQPHLQLHLLQSMSGQALERLENNELDAAFIYGRADSDKIISFDLHKLKLVVAAPIKWKKKLDAANPKDLENFPWIMTPEDCPFHQVTSELFKKYDISPEEVANVDQESVIKAMVKAGLGISVLLERDVIEDSWQDHFAVWDKEDLNINLSITCLNRRKDEPLVNALISVLLNVWSPVVP